MNSYTLRPATRADFPAIRLLIRRVRINPLGLAWRNFIIAVDKQGELIGCGQIKPHGDGSRELASIAVMPQWRGRGVAGAIIRALMAAHTGWLYLTCRTGLGPFYKRFGFRVAQPAELSPYFRRLSRAVRVLRLLRLTPAEGLLVMVACDSPAESAAPPPA